MSCATVAEVLKNYGYATSAFGKWHNTPALETTAAGPFHNWPTGFSECHRASAFGMRSAWRAA